MATVFPINRYARLRMAVRARQWANRTADNMGNLASSLRRRLRRRAASADEEYDEAWLRDLVERS